jgi:Tol biopolymer transport system component
VLHCAPFSAGGQYDVSPNGTLVYLSGKTRDALWSMGTADRTGKMQLLPIPPGQYRFPIVSPDGKSIAWVTASRDLWVYDIARETATRVMNSQSAGSNDQPVWSPDSKHLILAGMEDKQGKGTLWCVRSDGAREPQQLFVHAGSIGANAFSPDGKRLAVAMVNGASDWDIATLPIDWTDPDHPVAGKPEPVVNTPKIEKESVFSPDGRWIAYRSADKFSLGDIFVQPFPEPGRRLQISSGGGSCPQWSHDGRQLFFVSPDNHIQVADITLQGSSLSAGKARIWLEKPLMDLNSARNYAVMPDGEHLLILPQSEQAAKKGPPRIVFLLNFFDELKRRIP